MSDTMEILHEDSAVLLVLSRMAQAEPDKWFTPTEVAIKVAPYLKRPVDYREAMLFLSRLRERGRTMANALTRWRPTDAGFNYAKRLHFPGEKHLETEHTA